MGWEFEHWENNKVYLHEQRWVEFRKKVDKYGQDYPHNWNHNRIFLCLHTPRNSILDLPAPGDDDLKYQIESYEKWNMIYESYPAFIRTTCDPEGWLPSWHMWAEDNNQNGEPLTILRTVGIYKEYHTLISFSPRLKNTFANFRGQFWNIRDFLELGIGPNEPPTNKLTKKKKTLAPRSIFDQFEGSW